MDTYIFFFGIDTIIWLQYKADTVTSESKWLKLSSFI